ncbi:MAG: hypothetical protein ACKOT0_03925 [bacterium]
MDDNGTTWPYPEEVYERYQRAAACGLIRRFGPSPEEAAGFPAWKHLLMRVLTVRQRWRLSALASYIRDFDRL